MATRAPRVVTHFPPIPIFPSARPARLSSLPPPSARSHFNVIIAGPTGSPYEGGVYKLELFLPSDYPMSSPKAHARSHTPSPSPIMHICKMTPLCIYAKCGPAILLDAGMSSLRKVEDWLHHSALLHDDVSSLRRAPDPSVASRDGQPPKQLLPRPGRRASVSRFAPSASAQRGAQGRRHSLAAAVVDRYALCRPLRAIQAPPRRPSLF